MGEIRIKREDGPAVYHVTSRVIQRRQLLAEGQREVWVAALHRAAEFSGVEVITYCVLETHFHILVRIDPAARLCDDATLVRRYRALYGGARAQWSGLNADELAHALEKGPPETAEALAGKETLCRSLAACFPAAKGTTEALAHYRLLMLGKRAGAKGDGTGARIDPAALLEAVKNGGELEPHELLRLRVRYFTEGRELGSRDWLERGGGARVFARLNRPPPRRPVELLEKADLAVARARARYRAVEDPRG